MTDREKVKCGLECCYDDNCGACPYSASKKCQHELHSDALALLREQEPRVMTLEEIIKLNDWVWVDYEDAFNGYEYKLEYDPDCGRVEWLNGATDGMEEYGKTWRCWTSRPSPEQMRDTKWEGEKE
jgi:hypothetical protein